MRKLSFAVVAVLALGCGGKKKAAEQLDCAAPVDHAMSLSADDFKKSNIDDAAIPKIRDASVTRCREDKWSNEVLKCLSDAKASGDVIACQNKMTKPQQESLAKAISSETGGGADDGSAGSAGSNGAGSDTGSAGSDSGSAGSDTGSAGSDTGSAGSGSAASDSGSAGSGAGSGSAGSN